MQALEKHLTRLAKQLAHTGWICQGSLVQQYQIQRRQGRRRRYGPYPIWTRKVQNKTATLALSPPQARRLAKALANRRRFESLLQRIHTLSTQWVLQDTNQPPLHRK